MFKILTTRSGYVCVARVNNREYESDAGQENERLAVENAAMRAYAICQNFSKSDGMYPPERKKKGSKVQGRPIAIGTERRARDSYYADDSRSLGSSSGDSSPTSYGSFSSHESGRRSIKGNRHGEPTAYSNHRSIDSGTYSSHRGRR